MAEQRKRGRIRRVLKRIAVAIGVLFIAGMIFLYWASTTGRAGQWAREEVVRELHDVCAVDATFETFTFDPFPPTMTMTGLDMKHLDGSPLLSVEEAIVSLQILPIFARRLQLDRVALLAPQAAIRIEDGRIPNMPKCVQPTEKKETAPIVLGIRELTIERGRFDLMVDRTLEARLDGIGVSLSPRTRSAGSDVAIGVDEGLIIYEGGRELPLHRFRFLGQLEGLLTAPRAVVIDALEISLAKLRIGGTGAIDLLGPVYEAKLEVNAPISSIHDFIDNAPKTEGDVHLEASVSGTAVNPSAVGRLVVNNPKFDNYSGGDLVMVDFRVNRKGVDVSSLEVRLGDGAVRGRARVDFDKHFTVRVETEEDALSMGRVLDCINVKSAWVDFRATGKALFSGTLQPFAIEGPFDLAVRDFYVFDRGWDKPEVRDRTALDPKNVLLHPGSVSVTGKWRFDEKGTTLSEATVRSGSTFGTAHTFVAYRSADGVYIKADLPSVDFTDIGPIANIKFTGRGQIHGVISGPQDMIGATGTVDLDDISVAGIPFGHARSALVWYDDTKLDFNEITAKLGETLYGGELDVAIEKETILAIDGKIASGRVEDVLVPFGVKAIDWGEPRGAVTGAFKLNGPVTKLSGPIDVAVNNGAIVGETYEKSRAVGRMERGTVVVEDFELQKHGATIIGRGRFDPTTRHVRATARTQGMTLQKIDLMAATEPDLDGKLAFDLSLGGRIDTVTGTISARLTEMRAGPLDLPNGSFSGRINGATIAVKGDLLGGKLEVDGDLSLAKKLPYRATLELRELDAPKILGALQGHSRWTGRLIGRARLQGNLLEWHLSSGDIALDHAAIDTGSFHLETAGPSLFNMRAGVLDTRHLSLIGPRTKLIVSGRMGARVLELEVQGKIDLGIVELLSSSVERSGGVLSLDSAVQGAPGSMNLVGTGKIDGGILQWRGFDERLSGFSADLVFSQSTVLIDRAEGRFADGRIGVTGNLLLSDYRVKNVSLAITLADVRPRLTYPLVELSGTLDGSLSVEGTPQRLLVRGELDVQRGRARPKLEITNLAGDRGRLSVNVYDPTAEILDLDIGFHGVHPLHVKNDTIDVELRGDLRLTETNQRFGMLGSTNIVRGGRVSVIGREYEMISGIIEFQDRYRFSPRYDLTLATDACSSRITVNVVGTLQQKPEPSYASNPEMDETDILSCLIRGVKVQDRLEDLAGLGSRAFWRQSGLDREVKKVLPIDDIEVSTEYSSQTKTYEPRVLIAKELIVFGGPARLEYTSSLGKKEDQEIRLRYRITPSLTLQGGWASSKIVQPVVGDLHLDLKYRWEW